MSSKTSPSLLPILILVSIIGFCLALLLISHFFFQKYLFMQPCEQCVYIRFYFCIIILGALAMLFRFIIAKIVGLILLGYGIIAGISHSLLLNKIHDAINNNGDIFGLSGCSLVPHFPLNLALDRWIPSLFKIYGDCGVDSPKIPKNIELDSIQQYFIELYSNGWYLLPKLKLLNMAECCIIAFIFIAILALAYSIIGLKSRVFKR